MQVCGEYKDEKIQDKSKNEFRRRGICFISKEPWEANHSRSSKMEKMTRLE